MKRTLIIVIGALALAGFLLESIAFPKAARADQDLGSALTAEAAATTEATTGFEPLNSAAQKSQSADEVSASAKEASVGKTGGLAEVASEHLDKPVDEGTAFADDNSPKEQEGPVTTASEQSASTHLL
jgi:Tfp pilus assembly protein PilV